MRQDIFTAGISAGREVKHKPAVKYPWPLVAILAAWLSGCSVGPNYVRPEVKLSPSWQESGVVDESEPANIREWWGVFNDPVLTKLVQEAFEQNLTLQAAGLRVIQARAARGIAVGDFFPQQQKISAQYSNNQFSRTHPDDSSLDRFRTAGLSFDAFWELDFWGKFRRNLDAADAALLASIADYDDVLVTLVGEVGLTYIEIRTLERRIELAKSNAELQRQSLEIAESRYRNGKVSKLDVVEAKSTLLNTEASVPDLESSLRDAKLSMCVLLGRAPEDLEEHLAASTGIPIAPAEIATGVPADLLRRRPDVRMAERSAAFQSEQIGIATADLFPSIALGGSIGFQATSAGNRSISNNLFERNSLVWSIGPALAWPILNYDRIRNNIRVQDAAFQEAAVNYQNTVLRAAAEVESSLYSFLKARQQLAYLDESTRNLEEALELSRVQYLEGDSDFLRVDIAAASLVRQQDNQAVVQGLVASNLIGAYKALGGGWELRQGREFIPEHMIEEMRNRTNWGNILDADYASRTDLGFKRPGEEDGTWLSPEPADTPDGQRGKE